MRHTTDLKSENRRTGEAERSGLVIQVVGDGSEDDNAVAGVAGSKNSDYSHSMREAIKKILEGAYSDISSELFNSEYRGKSRFELTFREVRSKQ